MEDLTPEALIGKYKGADPQSYLPMLVGLDDVDWAQLSHAHGAASDIPALFRALLSENETHRDFACHLLHETIWHQGCVYEASVAAIPFLFRFMESPKNDVRACAASLLGAIADGSHYLKHLASDEGDGEQFWREILSQQGLNLEAEIAKEARVVAAAKERIGQNLQSVFGHITDIEPEVRRWVANLFRLYPDRARETIPLLNEAFKTESNNWAKDAMKDSLNLLGA